MNRQLLIISAVFLFASRPLIPQQKPAIPPAQKADAALSEGIRAFQAGKLEVAIRRFREACQLFPDNPFTRLNLGLALYAKNNDSPEAQHIMESVLDKFPEHPDLQLRLLHSYLIAKNTEKASSLVERLQGRMTREPRFAFDVLYTLVSSGQPGLARSELDKTSNRLQGEVLFIYGLIAVQSNQKQDALRLFDMASSHNFPPPDSPQMVNLAESYFGLQEFPRAAKAYEAYLDHFPQGLRHRFRLGLCYYAFGDHAKAKEQFEKSLELIPQPPELDYYLAATLVEMKKSEEARPYLEAELRQNPSSFRALTKLAYVDYLKGDNEQCRKRLEQATVLEPNWFETHLVYGMLFSRLGDYEQAIKNLELAVTEEPNYWKTHYQLAQAYQRVGNEAKAKEFMDSYNRLFSATTSSALEARGLGGKEEEQGESEKPQK
jgi:tetratricopeptide (TPR) repeat protein